MGISDIDLQVMDLDWLSSDCNGNIAHLMTGGAGLIKNSNQVSRADLDLLLKFVASLKDNDSIPQWDSFVRRKSGRTTEMQSEWAKARFEKFRVSISREGRCGLFVYDAVPGKVRPMPYQRLLAPSVPLRITELPATIAALVRKMMLPDVCFVRDTIIDSRLCGNDELENSG